MNTRPGVQNMILTASNGGLYYKYMINTKGVYILNTAKENQKHYTQQQYVHANISRDLYQGVGHP